MKIPSYTDKKILTDGKGNLYYRYYGGEDGSRYSIRQVNYSNPENIVAIIFILKYPTIVAIIAAYIFGSVNSIKFP